MPVDPAYLRSARHLATRAFIDRVREGDRVVDATLGTGQDCALLCELVGEIGQVDGFDVQQATLDRTWQRLHEQGLSGRARLHLLGHERMAEVVQPGIRLAAFNLGWLPGSDKAIRTNRGTTLQAVGAALDLLMAYGLLVVCVYPGHEEGKLEQDALLAFAGNLPNRHYSVLWQAFSNAGPGAPACLMIEKLPGA